MNVMKLVPAIPDPPQFCRDSPSPEKRQRVKFNLASQYQLKLIIKMQIMQKVILEITMSIDGFIAGPGISAENPLGIEGRKLHKWIFEEKTPADEALLKETMNAAGAVIMGHRTYATAIEDAWEGVSPFDVPVFVLCREQPVIAAGGFTFVQDGIESALAQAVKVAADKDTWIMGGANVAQQYLYAGLVDELRLHIAPIILGRGTKLFTTTAESLAFVKTRVIDSDAVTHLFYTKV